MIAKTHFGSSTFKLVARNLVALHRLIMEGKDDSPEAEAIRDSLEAPLKTLSKSEKERAQWLSEDLYAVSELGNITTLEMNQQAQRTFIAAVEARQRHEWDRALFLARQVRNSISPPLLSYFRGSTWHEAGYPEIAVEFLGHALQIETENENFRMSYLNSLSESDPEAAGKIAREILANDQKYAPIVVVEAARVHLRDINDLPISKSSQLCHELIPILDRNLSRIGQENAEANDLLAMELTLGKLGVCHENLGNIGIAVEYFNRAIQINPNDDVLLVARGVLLFGNSPRAVTDFKRAVEIDSQLIWPFLFLAHHFLATSQFEECRVQCEKGLRMSGSNVAKSRLEEYRAIAQVALGFSSDSVRAAFESAIRLNPSNDLARSNFKAYEEALRQQNTSNSWWTQANPASLRQIESSERSVSSAA